MSTNKLNSNGRIIKLLSDGPLTPKEIASKLKLPIKNVHETLTSLASLNLLKVSKNDYKNSVKALKAMALGKPPGKFEPARYSLSANGKKVAKGL
jgi:hypothetical protein